MTYWRIFWRTFAQLMLAVVVAAQALDWVSDQAAFTQNADKLGAMTLMALIGGLLAAGWAFVQTPATSAVQKGLRSGLEALLGGLGTIAINSFADITSLAALVVPPAVGVVLAFAFTFFQYQPAPPPMDTAQRPPAHG